MEFNILARKTLSAWANGETVEVVKNPKNGKLFLTCGGRVAAISEKAGEAIDSLKEEDVEVCTYINLKGEQMDCLMMRNKTNIVRTFKF